MMNINELYAIALLSRDKNELIGIIRSMTPGTRETSNIVYRLEKNEIFDSTLRLEVACKMPDRYRSFEIVDDIIACAANTELMKRLYEADINDYGAFVAVQITEPYEIEKMYNSGIYEIQCAAASNFHASPEFLKKIIAQSDNEYIKELAYEVLQVLTVQQTNNPDLIEEMYKAGGYDVRLAAVSNSYAREEFIESVVFDEDVPEIIRERAMETFEKISST